MTGEITLRRRVWPVDGLKEKLLAALRGGIKTVLIPEENAKDLIKIPDSVKGALKIISVSRMDDVLDHSLVRKLEPIAWEQGNAMPAEGPSRRASASSISQRPAPTNKSVEGQAASGHPERCHSVGC